MTFFDRRKSFALVLMSALCTPIVHANDFAAVDQLLKQGQPAKAQQIADQYLIKHPKDARMRFRKALSLADQGKTDAAIQTFSALVRDYPSMAEARNNLAVLHALRGDYDKAQAELEQVLASNSAYSAAYKNLSNIYERQARLSYERALRSSERASKPEPQAQLVLLRGLNRQQFAEATTTPPSTILTTATRTDAKPATPASTPKPAATPTPTVAAIPKPAAPAAPPTIATAPPKPAAAPTPNTPPKTETPPASDEATILATVEAWAKAWSNKDVDAYFAHYAKNFHAPDGRSAWEKSRRERILKPGKIHVKILSPDIRIKNERAVDVHFRQDYKSNTFNANSGKTLELVYEHGRWLILKETVGSGR